MWGRRFSAAESCKAGLNTQSELSERVTGRLGQLKRQLSLSLYGKVNPYLCISMHKQMEELQLSHCFSKKVQKQGIGSAAAQSHL